MTKPARVCLFTGISGRLGRAFVERHAGDYRIVGVYHRNPPTTPWAPLTADPGPSGGVLAVECDLGAEGAVDDLVHRVLERFGTVDLVVNAAVHRSFGPATDQGLLDTLDWQLFLNVSVPAQIVGLLTREAWCTTPTTNAERRRNVVNLSSTAGHIAYPGSGQAGYSASKAALDMFTRHSAAELSEISIRVNAVAPNTFPGLVATRSVVDAIRRLDKGRQTGRILVIDTDGERMLPSGRPARR